MKFYNYLNESKYIPDKIIDELKKDRSHWKNIKKDLRLPIVQKGEYLGYGNPQDCEGNTKKFVKNNPNALKFEGYLIWYDKDNYEWKVVHHTFPVMYNKVMEVTPLEDKWDENTYYIGKKK